MSIAIGLLAFSFNPRYLSMEAALCCGESDLWSEVKKFTAKRRPETTLPTWTSAAGLADPKTDENSLI